MTAKMTRVFNVRLALYTLLLAAVCGPAVYVWHAYQIRREAQAFLERADQLEAKQERIAAAGYLHRYLSLKPKESAVRVRMAKTLDEGATSGPEKNSAVNVYYQTLGLVPQDEQPVLRRRLTELLLEMHRFPAAKDEAMKLLAADDKDPQGRRLLALALLGQVQSGGATARSKDSPSVSQAFESALQDYPGDVQLTPILAGIYRSQEQLLDEKKQAMPRAEREALADRLIEQMTQVNPANPDAYLARYAYRIKYRLAGAEEDVRAALKHGPNNIDALQAAAELARQNGRAHSNAASFQEARGHYEHIVQTAPREERGYLLLGELDWELGERSRAVDTWRHGLKETNKDSLALHQRLAGALVVLGRADEAAASLDTLDKMIALYGRRLSPGERAALECSRDLVRGQWWLLKGDSTKASSLLRRVVAQSASAENALRNFQAWMLLGRIATAEGQSDQAAMAYEQAAALQPQSAAARLAAARAWAGAGRPDLALRHGEQALAIEDTAETSLFLAETQYQRQLTLPQKQRNWQIFRNALAKTMTAVEKQPLPEPWRLNVLRANSLLAGASQQPVAEARRSAAELLRAAESEHPKSTALLQLLPAAFERLGCAADADRALLELEKLPAQTLPTLLCRFQLCMSRKQYRQARDVLQAGVAAHPPESLRLRLALASVSVEEGRQEQAFQELTKLQADFPNSLLLLRQLVEMAGELGKNDEAERCEEKLREREGPDGLFWRYFRARRLLAKTRDVKDPQFVEAEKLADELQVMRPAWPSTYLLQGIVAKQRGKNGAAIDAYKNAILFGEQRIRVYEQLVHLLYAERRFTEAAEYLGLLETQVPFSENLSALEISLASQAGHLDRALAAARRGVESRPKDTLAQIWLGQTLLASGQKQEAERAFQVAVKGAPKDVRTHNALFDFYLRTQQLTLAARTLEELNKNVELSEADRVFVLAQGHEQLGNASKEGGAYLKTAAAQYEESERLNPQSLAVLERRALFLLNRDPVAAEKVLRRMLEVDPRTAGGRRLLAALLASHGHEKDWQEAQQLLETPGAQSSPAEQRLQATLLARRGGKENFAKARRIVEEITADPKSSLPSDYLLLAQLLEADGQPEMARQHYLTLASRAAAETVYLVQYVDFLLRHGASKDATPWVDQLHKKLPDDLGVLALRVRWLHDQKRGDEIGPAVEALAERLLEKLPADAKNRVAQEAQLSQEVGNVYTAIQQHAAAERWYRRLRKLDVGRFAPLAGSLARQNRLAEAIAVCVEAAKADASIQPAIVLTGVLGVGRPTAVEFKLAEPLLAQTLAQHGNDANLLNGVASVRILQQRSDEAIALYRRVVSLKPHDVLALNNLATLLAEQPTAQQEALRTIDEAIDVAGRLPILLDTKGTILVYNGNAADAVPLLTEAATAANVDPRFLFHLSLACAGAGKLDEARDSLKKALAGNLMQQILTSTDHRLLEELKQKLGS